MKGIGKGLVSLMVLMGVLWFGTHNVHAQDESIQDSAFTFFNGAERIADSTAPDQYSARMANDNTGWNIQYMNWDFSHLKPGTLYDVYVKA